MADQTYVTPRRLTKLRLMQGAALDDLLASCGDDDLRAKLLEALCLSWFGPIRPIAERSDRNGAHARPERRWLCLCQWCDGQHFYASRPDARYCSNKCRQAAYRWRQAVNLPENLRQ